ncbi:MAG: hypothetical protein EBX52_09395, partial [Proteobacteria bacterium]|nr:hypothetical protein [Pseudomonadota bacterium]
MSIRSVRVSSRSIEDRYRASLGLTRFLKSRGLTFQMNGPDGIPQTFTVPVTSSVVSLTKSKFNAIERAARLLVVSLRHILRDLYGSPSIPESSFVASLPPDVRGVFLRATLESPHYFAQLHHPAMREYPFMDTVGLDLVRIENEFPESGGSDLPFRLLEVNAGSPSGAANLMTILEGLRREDPAALESLGRVMSNDHFRILRETYRSIGESWTGRRDGIQIILPPGGGNGAAPEIHQLAACSGLIYCDPGQLFTGDDGFLRMRTVCGSNPVVTAIHSRVNSDSALFDPAERLLLRDPETGEPLYCLDTLKPWKGGKPEYLRDSAGIPVPLESAFAVPGALKAIRERRLFLGGLNRLIDNKILLPILTRYAIPFSRQALQAEGLDPREETLQPPEALPPNRESLEVIARNPGDWVIKSPNLSGGKGVHILVSLDRKDRNRVLAEARRNPERFAFQRRISMGRVPVVVRGRRTGRLRVSDRATDLRMWMFFAQDGSLPRLTHNGLVRVAPGSKGPSGMLVNTSQGGGYAPFAVVDDLDTPGAVPALEAARPHDPVRLEGGIPAFVGAQLIQIAHLIRELRGLVRNPSAPARRFHRAALALQSQLREVASFLHPSCTEAVSKMLTILERELDPLPASSGLNHDSDLAELVALLAVLDPWLSEDVFDLIDGFHILDPEVSRNGYPVPARREDEVTLGRLNVLILRTMMKIPAKRKSLGKLCRVLARMTRRTFPARPLPAKARSRIESLLEWFGEQADRRLRDACGNAGTEVGFGAFFRVPRPGNSQSVSEQTASGWEAIHQKRLVDTDWIDPLIARIRTDWLRVLAGSESVPSANRAEFLEEARVRHFRDHPSLAEFQEQIDRSENTGSESLIGLMKVLPYAGFNLARFAEMHGMPVRNLFREEPGSDCIAILSRADQVRLGIPAGIFAGECFARKRSRHGLLSESEIHLWVAREQSPLIQLFTIGHELVHHDQLLGLMEEERAALRDGGLSFAEFLNRYGNHMVEAVNAREEGLMASAC